MPAARPTHPAAASEDQDLRPAVMEREELHSRHPASEQPPDEKACPPLLPLVIARATSTTALPTTAGRRDKGRKHSCAAADQEQLQRPAEARHTRRPSAVTRLPCA